MGNIVSSRNERSYLDAPRFCPNLYAVTEKTGAFSKRSYWYCTATKREIDNGYKKNVCSWVGDKTRGTSCSSFDGRIYPL